MEWIKDKMKKQILCEKAKHGMYIDGDKIVSVREKTRDPLRKIVFTMKDSKTKTNYTFERLPKSLIEIDEEK
jgi:hypothetical protein